MNTSDSETNGPDRVHVELMREVSRLVEANEHWHTRIEQMKSQLEQAQRELEEAKRELAEADHAIQISAELYRRVVQERDRYRELLERADLAMHDWLHTYAPEFSDVNDVARSRSRISRLGTIGYIAEVIAFIREALHPKPSAAQQASESDEAVTREDKHIAERHIAERVVPGLVDLNSKLLMTGGDYSDILLDAADLIERLLAADAKLKAYEGDIADGIVVQRISYKDMLVDDAKLESQQGSVDEPVGEIKRYRVWLDHDEAPGREGFQDVVIYSDHLKAMRARVPEGWVLVPVEPTEEMLNNARGYFMIPMDRIKYAYEAFLESAPKPERDSVSRETRGGNDE